MKGIRKTIFTLIEMLIVVAIILILLSLIQPALKNAIEQALRVSCLNNLRHWSMAIFTHSDDNHGQIMSQIDRYGRRNSLKMHSTEDGNNIFSGATYEWSIYQINPYLDGFDHKNRGKLKDVSLCPSTDIDLWRDHNLVQFNGLGVVLMQYSYFGRSDEVRDDPRWNGNNAKEHLVGKLHDASSGQVLMADAIHYDNSVVHNGRKGGWSYNHGQLGEHYGWDHFGRLPSFFGFDYGPIPQYYLGGNRVYGDGSARWDFVDPDLYPGSPGLTNAPHLGPGDLYFW